MSSEIELEAIDIVSKEEVEAMSDEERTAFYTKINESKHAYVNNILAETFKDVKKSAEFVETIHELVKRHIVEVNDAPHIPNFSDVLYNLTVYSACVLERLSYGKQYRTDWIDPTDFTPAYGASYMLMLSCGFIVEGSVDSMEPDIFTMHLADCTTRIHKNRLLAINTAVTTADDFLRGVPKIVYDALGKIESSVVPVTIEPIAVTKVSNGLHPTNTNKTLRNRERRKRRGK